MRESLKGSQGKGVKSKERVHNLMGHYLHTKENFNLFSYVFKNDIPVLSLLLHTDNAFELLTLDTVSLVCLQKYTFYILHFTPCLILSIDKFSNNTPNG